MTGFPTSSVSTSSAIAAIAAREASVLPAVEVTGSISRIESSFLRARFPACTLHTMLTVERNESGGALLCRVVAIQGDECTLSPLGNTGGIRPGASVRRSSALAAQRFGPEALGMAHGSSGEPVLRFGRLVEIPEHLRAFESELRTTHSAPPPPLSRRPVSERFHTGIRALDAFTTLGRGQRVGIFAEPGVGKTSLLESIVHAAEADVVIIALIGERGREVGELIEQHLSDEARSRTAVFFSTGEEPPFARIHAAECALKSAEYFRDRGCSVLLVVDSLTRLCRAFRDVGLIAGEPPVRRGYPHSVFARLPEFIERAGNNAAGSITALYTVLSSADLDDDPMVEEVKSLTDGHILLKRNIAESGRYPAVDVIRSVSRLQTKLLDPQALSAARVLRAALSRLERDRELLLFGATGDDALRKALELEPAVSAFLAQGSREKVPFETTRATLLELARKLSEVPPHDAEILQDLANGSAEPTRA